MDFKLVATRLAIYFPISGAEVRPGDSIPAALKKLGTSEASPMMKSSTEECARNPLKEVMTILAGSEVTLSLAFAIMSSRPALVVVTSVLED